MQRIVTLLIASAALAACSTASGPERAPGASFYQTKQIPIKAASALAVRGPFKVTVNGNADAPELTLMGPAEMIADTRVSVEDGTVSIRFVEGANWSWNTGAGMHAIVYLPTLRSVALQGSGQVDVRGAQTDTFEAATSGSGSIKIQRLKAQSVQLGVGGSGSILVQGTAQSASIGVGGSGSVDAKRLRVVTSEIGVGGSGSVYADVSEAAQIGVGGSGRVEIVGGAKCTFAPSQARQIDCR